MNFVEWVETVPGGVTTLARKFGLTKGAISHWKRAGVPVRYMRDVQEISLGLVTLDEMVPPIRRKEVKAASE